MTDKKLIKYSEIFHSFQGEGSKTGANTAWIRFFTCNLQCEGFNQKDPTDPSTYILPYKDFDVSTVSCVEDLPVWEYGCDSSYSFAKKFRHLGHDATPAEVCDRIQASLIHESNPLGLFQHPLTLQQTHMAFTGGEPMLNQQAIVDILNEFKDRKNYPNCSTMETNGTKKFAKAGLDTLLISSLHETELGRPDWFWSVSPKLWSTAGEKFKKAIKPEIVASYHQAYNNGQLKYVVNGTKDSWDEVEEATRLFRAEGVNWDVYIMPVGATKEQQEDEQIAEIAVEAMKRGYHVSGRLHTYIFGNAVGT